MKYVLDMKDKDSFIEAFKRIDMPMKFALVGTVIALVGYVLVEVNGGNFSNIVMYGGMGVGVFGWVWCALQGNF